MKVECAKHSLTQDALEAIKERKLGFLHGKARLILPTLVAFPSMHLLNPGTEEWLSPRPNINLTTEHFLPDRNPREKIVDAHGLVTFYHIEKSSCIRETV